jgi:hypothetical protein
MGGLPEIGGLWVGSDLSFLEQLSIKSYLDRGHPYTLYTLSDVGRVPTGVTVRPASDILAPPFDISDGHRLRTVCYSNLFRMEMFQRTDAIWADLDTYCVRALVDEPVMIFGRTHNQIVPHHVNTSTLRLSRSSATLEALQTFFALKDPVPPWDGTRFQKKVERFRRKGRSWQIQDLPWGASGHRALTHFLNETGEIADVQPVEAFHSINQHNYAWLFDRLVPTDQIEAQGVKVLHMFGKTRAIIADQFKGEPPAQSYLSRICARHSIDPKAAPVT